MIPRTLFSSDHELFRDSVRKFLEQEAVPFHPQWEKDGHIDRALWNKAGEAGMLCSHIPEEYGGMGADFLYSAVVIEEIGRLGLTGIGFSLHSDIVAPYILHYGSEAQKQKYLPKLVTGELVTAIAMTEPGAGSDLQGVKTTAVLDGDEYVINGSKTFITNGWLADLVIVVAKTDPKAGAKGTSLFLVEANTPGFSKGKRLEKVGQAQYESQQRLVQSVDDNSRAWRVVRTFDAADFELQRFDQEANTHRRMTLKQVSTSSLVTPASQVVAAIGVSIIITLAIWQASQGSSTIGEFVSFVTTPRKGSFRARPLPPGEFAHS